ncbi:MAG: zf-HC2 domain-containing protein [Candidatus Coatesbacteria bacterium]|nr:zf-HC2 domain-containing protein [Candidatus Coatesbacteria bacterium]
MDCKDFELLISKSFDKEIKPEELQMLNSHLEKCSSCSNFLKQLNLLNSSMNEISQGPVVEIPLSRLVKKQIKMELPVWLKIAASFFILVSGSISGYYLGEKFSEIIKPEKTSTYVEDIYSPLKNYEDNYILTCSSNSQTEEGERNGN